MFNRMLKKDKARQDKAIVDKTLSLDIKFMKNDINLSLD